MDQISVAIIMDTPIEEFSSRILERQNHPTEVQDQKEGFERIISIKPQPTSVSYNDKVIEEILTKLNEKPITNFKKFNIKDEIIQDREV
ncbi:16462_t:CDS:2, partial [Gigaspora margarita]